MSARPALWLRRGLMLLPTGLVALLVAIGVAGGAVAWVLRPQPVPMPAHVDDATLSSVRVAIDKPRDVTVIAIGALPETRDQIFNQDALLVYVEAHSGESVRWSIELATGDKPGLDPLVGLGKTQIAGKKIDTGLVFSGAVKGPTDSQQPTNHLRHYDLRDVIIIPLGKTPTLSQVEGGVQVAHVPEISYWYDAANLGWKPANPTLFSLQDIIPSGGQMVTLAGPAPTQEGGTLSWEDPDIGQSSFTWVGRQLTDVDRDSTHAFWSGVLAAVAASALLTLVPLAFGPGETAPPARPDVAATRRPRPPRSSSPGRRRYVPRTLRRRPR